MQILHFKVAQIFANHCIEWTPKLQNQICNGEKMIWESLSFTIIHKIKKYHEIYNPQKFSFNLLLVMCKILYTWNFYMYGSISIGGYV